MEGKNVKQQFEVGQRVLHVSGCNTAHEKYNNKTGVIVSIEKSPFEEGGDLVVIDFSEHGHSFARVMNCYNDDGSKTRLVLKPL